MAYSKKLLDHYENPQNVGSFNKNESGIGTGLVGAPACGDVMKLQIKVAEDGTITDAKFKTFGCLTSNNLIATPQGYTPISKLRAGDEVWAWNGTAIVSNKVKSNTKSAVHYSKLIKLDFGLRKTITCTNDHIWWSADNRPIEAKDLTSGMELLCATKNEFKSWANPEYVKNWQAGMDGASEKRPTKIEKSFIDLFESNEVDARYVGNGSFWVNCQDGAKLNPDFKINGQRKLIEVYDSNLPHFMMNRSTEGWMIKRKQQFAESGFDVMFIEINQAQQCLSEVQRFIHNGIELKSAHTITDKRDLRGFERSGDEVAVYDLALEEGANIFFVQRVMSHNCGSAIASSSLATEWIKGQKIDEAAKITNSQIAQELSLPPVKIHCSVLAEEAIKAAIEDYKSKKN